MMLSPSSTRSETLPVDLRKSRIALGLSQSEAARLLGYETDNGKAQYRKMESGLRPVMPAQRRLMEAYLAGYRPPDWPTPPREIVIERSGPLYVARGTADAVRHIAFALDRALSINARSPHPSEVVVASVMHGPEELRTAVDKLRAAGYTVMTHADIAAILTD